MLNRLKENRTLLATTIKWKGDWIGYIITGKGIVTTVLEDTAEGERRKGI